jgi:hypothetical protein
LKGPLSPYCFIILRPIGMISSRVKRHMAPDFVAEYRY